ncbi:hypothetical protein EVAR_81687_1 [Eumeta japonica]|uniref:Uncharacterized protein n=1 Tax=Eumeta variegata TaxID=151549 RepID=A0A4C1V3H2_EUMVA|nr:hypothetical protein EVAR_81687_1 [Eumeta japonica]
MLALLLLLAALCWYGMFRWRRRRMYELAALVPGPPEFPLIGHLLKFSGSTQGPSSELYEENDPRRGLTGGSAVAATRSRED